MAKKVWRSFNFIVEVAIESPGDLDEDEAAEDAADFVAAMCHMVAKVGQSFGSVVKAHEAGQKRPEGYPVIFNGVAPTGRQVALMLPRGIERDTDFVVRSRNEHKPGPVKAKLKQR